jgi:uncharacterized protein YbjT (DUF2867 family)
MTLLRQNILVTGATGKQGGALAQTLLKRGHRVRAMVRRLDSPKAQALRKVGVELAVGSFDDRASVQRAAQGVDVVFAMSTPYEGGASIEVRQGKAMADAIKVSSVGHLIYASVAGANQKTGVPYFDSKHQIEEHIGAIGIPFTVVAPVFFMENFLSPDIFSGFQDGRLAMPLPAQRLLQQIAVEDIGAVVAQVVERKREFLGQRIEIASDELSGQQTSEVLSEASGRPIQYQELPLEGIRSSNKDAASMFEWLDRVGMNVNIPALHRQFSGVRWHTFKEWAKFQDWSALKQPAAH